MKIPRIIFQTHKSQDYVNSSPLLRCAQDTWRTLKGFEYRFFDDEAMDRFIYDHFDDKIVETYNKCHLPVMKADIWRYCVVYVHGGIYADADLVYKNNIHKILQDDVLLVLGPENNTDFCQWIFAAPPRSPLLKSVIELIVERFDKMPIMKREHVVHHLTGPHVFTHGIQQWLREHDYPIYDTDLMQYIDTPISVLGMLRPEDVNSLDQFVMHMYASTWLEDGWVKQRDRLFL